jgi:hypothetical protein
MESWDIIKSSALYQSVHMELSLCLRFYLMHSLGSYMVGTTMGFPVEIVETLAPQSHRRVLRKCPQYHMRTCSAHCRLTGSGHLFNGGLRGYCQGKVTQVHCVTSYGPKFWIRLVPSSSKRLENHTPRTRKMTPPLQAKEEQQPT